MLGLKVGVKVGITVGEAFDGFEVGLKRGCLVGGATGFLVGGATGFFVVLASNEAVNASKRTIFENILEYKWNFLLIYKNFW